MTIDALSKSTDRWLPENFQNFISVSFLNLVYIYTYKLEKECSEYTGTISLLFS